MMAADTKPLISIRDLRVGFRFDEATQFEAVKGISFDIPANSREPGIRPAAEMRVTRN